MVAFQHNIANMINSFLVSFEIPDIINILYEIIKILHQ